MQSKYINSAFSGLKNHKTHEITLSAILYIIRKNIRFFRNDYYCGNNMSIRVLDFDNSEYADFDRRNYTEGEGGQIFTIYVNHFQNEHHYLITEYCGRDSYHLEVISNVSPSISEKMDSYAHEDTVCWLVQIAQELENVAKDKET